MEMHIIDIVRFATCILSFIIAIVAMIKADDNNAMRRLSALLAGVLIFFNEQIGSMVYLLIGCCKWTIWCSQRTVFRTVCADDG